MIPVTKPFMPPVEEYIEYIYSIWNKEWLTNQGPVLNKFELELKRYLNVKNFLFLNNGTLALQMAIRSLDLKGEIVTTPYSYVATTSSIVWENCKPVFVDIDPQSLNMDVSKIESAINDRTTAILATHVFGNPCDVYAIQRIAEQNNLKIIYDAAHAFGVRIGDKSIFDYGDISVASFHATKLFHTVEGGGFFTNSAEILRKVALMRSFGHTTPINFEGVGINGKNSELHAAMGICVLRYMDHILERRKAQFLYYDTLLSHSSISRQEISPNCQYNYAYYVIVFEDEGLLQKVTQELNNHYIYPKRYFYPSLNKLHYLENAEECPVSVKVAEGSLCLPLFHHLSQDEQEMVCRIILRVLHNS
jgi:dTDP-4-amino-4,6-dideoxygalactose transaminase